MLTLQNMQLNILANRRFRPLHLTAVAMTCHQSNVTLTDHFCSFAVHQHVKPVGPERFILGKLVASENTVGACT